MKCPEKGHFAFTGKVLLAMAILLGTAAAQTASVADFAGTWKAEFHKQTWMILTLIAERNTLTGTLQHSTEISADDEGDITSVGEDLSTDKIVAVELHGETLHIRARDEDGIEDDYTLVLNGKDAAELEPLVAEGQNAPKAFKLKRAANPQK